MASTARSEFGLPSLHQLPALVFDSLVSFNISRLNQYLSSLYGRPHGRLGRLVGHVMAFEHVPVTHWALSLLAPMPEDRVLDVGCGAGRALERLALMAHRGFVAGLDHSEIMVRQSLARNQAYVREGRLDVRLGDVARMPFAEGSFDKVVSIETLYFWPDPRAALAEMYRVLAPRGRVALALEYTKESSRTDSVSRQMESLRFYSGAELRSLLEGAGFTQLRCETEPTRGSGWLYVEGSKPAP